MPGRELMCHQFSHQRVTGAHDLGVFCPVSGTAFAPRIQESTGASRLLRIGRTPYITTLEARFLACGHNEEPNFQQGCRLCARRRSRCARDVGSGPCGRGHGRVSTPTACARSGGGRAVAGCLSVTVEASLAEEGDRATRDSEEPNGRDHDSWSIKTPRRCNRRASPDAVELGCAAPDVC